MQDLSKEKDMKGKKRFGIIPSKGMLIDKFFPSKTLLVEMYHVNGTVSHFILKTGINKFSYKGNGYVIDEERKVYNNSSKLYMMRYHESFVMPFSVNINGQEMKDKVLNSEDANLIQVSTSFNPYVLPGVLKGEYAKGVIQGAEVSDMLKKVFWITAGALISSLIAAGMGAKAAGLF